MSMIILLLAIHKVIIIMNEMTRLIENYSRCHQHPINELIHFFAIPIIMFSIIGLIYCIHSLVAVIFIFISLKSFNFNFCF